MKLLGSNTLRLRAESFNSTTETFISRVNSFNFKAETKQLQGYLDLIILRLIFKGDYLIIEEALRLDKSAEENLEVDNSPFTFSLG